MKRPGIAFGLIFSAIFFCAGCAGHAARTVPEDQFIGLYNDKQTYTDVWYMGSDNTYDYFCMEHWTLKPDGNDATQDSRDFFRVALTNDKVKRPFALSNDENKWRLMRPQKPSSMN